MIKASVPFPPSVHKTGSLTTTSALLPGYTTEGEESRPFAGAHVRSGCSTSSTQCLLFSSLVQKVKNQQELLEFAQYCFLNAFGLQDGFKHELFFWVSDGRWIAPVNSLVASSLPYTTAGGGSGKPLLACVCEKERQAAHLSLSVSSALARGRRRGFFGTLPGSGEGGST